MFELSEFASGLREMLRDNRGSAAQKLIGELGLGQIEKKFRFKLDGKAISILSPLKSLGTVFSMARRLLPEKDYELTIRGISEKTAKNISKRFSGEIPLSEAERDLLFGAEIDKIMYETITCGDFKITYSEYEGTTVRTEDEDYTLRIFRSVLGLFPYADISKDVKEVTINCEFNMREWDIHKRSQKYRADIKCVIQVNGQIMGTESSGFVF